MPQPPDAPRSQQPDTPSPSPSRQRLGRWLGWAGAALAAAAGAAHLVLLAWIVLERVSYPFDLEWMEGGTLCTALRILAGKPVYAPPNAEHISFLYTPLYPALVALLGKLFGVTYSLGRTISIVSFGAATALLAAAVTRQVRPDPRRLLWGVAAAGLIASTFPHCGAWFDLVRNDSLYLALTVGGLYLIAYRSDRTGWLVLAGVLLALAFLTKQTASLFILFAGAVMLLRSWRRTPILVATVALVAGGAVLLLNHRSGGWFWKYVFEMHQGHHFFPERLLVGTPLALLRAAPVVFVLIVAWGVVALVRWRVAARRADAAWAVARLDLFWLAAAAVGTATAAIGFATQWAYVNAFIPALVLGAAFAAIAAAELTRWATTALRPLTGGIVGLALGAALAGQMVWSLYDPRPHLPDRYDRAAGWNLIKLLRAVDGPVLVPYHPYYAHLAGKPTAFHHMGIKDVTRAGHRFPLDIYRRVRGRYYAAVVLDQPPQIYGSLLSGYFIERRLRPYFSPRLVTGSRSRPSFLLLPQPADDQQRQQQQPQQQQVPARRKGTSQ